MDTLQLEVIEKRRQNVINFYQPGPWGMSAKMALNEIWIQDRLIFDLLKIDRYAN